MTGAFALVRAVHFAAVLSLFGSQVFSLLLRRNVSGAAPYALTARYQIWMSALALVTILLSIGFVAGEMTGTAAFDPSAMWRVARYSLFGHVAVVRIGLLAAFLVATTVSHETASAMRVLLAACALAAMGLTSHAAASGESALWLVFAANDAVHLLAAGFWVGGLAVLANAIARRAPTTILIAMLQDFSSRGMFAVAALIAAGVVNGALILGKTGMQWSATYTTLLAIKLVLASLMVALALANRFSLLPGMRSGRAEATESLSLSVYAELACGAAVLLIVGFLGLTAPMAM